MGWPDDVCWATQMRATGKVRTQHVIDDCMYLYFSSTTDSVQMEHRPRRPSRPHRMSQRKLAALAEAAAVKKVYDRPDITWPGFRWVE